MYLREKWGFKFSVLSSKIEGSAIDLAKEYKREIRMEEVIIMSSGKGIYWI